MLDAWEFNEGASFVLLGEACASFDRLQNAKAILKEDGHLLTDRFGQKKMNPICTVVRDEAATLVRLLHALGLNLQDIQDRPGRPDGFQPDVGL